jgi:hypothetical protein
MQSLGTLIVQLFLRLFLAISHACSYFASLSSQAFCNILIWLATEDLRDLKELNTPHMNAIEKKRVRDCNAKAISKDLVEDFVIRDILDNILSPDKIPFIAKAFNEKIQDSLKTSVTELEYINERLGIIQEQIDNIVNAIASGMFHPSMKEKMDNLEYEKNNYLSQKNDTCVKQKLSFVTDEMLTVKLEKLSFILTSGTSKENEK